MFRGIHAVNLDPKGRFALPTRYRERVQADGNTPLVLTIDTEEKCLLLYPLHRWELIENQLTALPSLSPAVRRIQRLLMGHANDVDMDNQGRILVAPLLRQYAHLEKRVILVGQGTKVEVWDETHWEERRATWLDKNAGDHPPLPDGIQSLLL